MPAVGGPSFVDAITVSPDESMNSFNSDRPEAPCARDVARPQWGASGESRNTSWGLQAQGPEAGSTSTRAAPRRFAQAPRLRTLEVVLPLCHERPLKVRFKLANAIPSIARTMEACNIKASTLGRLPQ